MLNEDLYLDFVVKKATNNGKFFLLDSGEGNGFIDFETDWYVEDLSGWYVNLQDRTRLMEAKERGTIYEEFSDSYIFVEWKKSDNGKLEILFKKY